MKQRLFFYLFFMFISLFEWIGMVVFRAKHPGLVSVQTNDKLFFVLIFCFHIFYILRLMSKKTFLQKLLYLLLSLFFSISLFFLLAPLAYKLLDALLELEKYDIFSNDINNFLVVFICLIVMFLLTTIFIWEVLIHFDNYINKYFRQPNKNIENDAFNKIKKIINNTKEKLESDVLLGNKDINDLINL